MTTATLILSRVERALDALFTAAQAHGGWIPGLLDRESGTMPAEFPPPIAGVRQSDRVFRGSNFIHDHPMLAVARALGREREVGRAFAAFGAAAATSPTGLFPWGEHLFWDFESQTAFNGYVLREMANGPTHDHLTQFPLWAWEKLWQTRPDVVPRFALALEAHKRAPREPHEAWEFNRHANYEIAGPGHHRQERSCDFPRHCGFFVFDCAFAWSKTGDEKHLENARWWADYWWARRDLASNLCAVESRSPAHETQFFGVLHAGQTLSLAVSLLESARIVGENPFAAQLRHRGQKFAEAFLRLPHDVSNAKIITKTRQNADDAAENSPLEGATFYGTRYGETSSAGPVGVLLCALWQITGDARALELAKAIGARYAREKMPEGVAVPARDAGRALELAALLAQITGEKQWRQNSLELAAQHLAHFCDFDDNPLPARAPHEPFYESQTGVAFLLHGLARVAFVAQNNAETLPPDFTAR